MKNHPGVCVIVDAFSAGRLLAPEFRARGFDCIHIQSSNALPAYYTKSFQPGDFTRSETYGGDLPSLIHSLERFPVRFVLAGTESGVELADQLSEHFGLCSNGTKMSAARRDKYRMEEAVRNRALRTALCLRSSKLEEILQWMNGKAGKVVVKPVQSAGTDSVRICSSAAEVQQAFTDLIGTIDMLGSLNRELLVQEFIEGTEYIVNSVSCRGRHYVTDIWQYHKTSTNDAPFVYDRSELLPFEGAVQTDLTKYAAGVLDALEIQYGPTHAEIFMTKEGPVLTEVGARLDGGLCAPLLRKCVGQTQLDLAVDAYTDPDAFFKKTEKPYRLREYAFYVWLIARKKGTVKSIPGMGAIRRFPSFFMENVRVRAGSELTPTTNLFTSPGAVYLSNADKRRLTEDYASIRAIEKNDLFEIEP